MKFPALLKLTVTPGERRFLKITGVVMLLIYGYHLWVTRDITWRWTEEVQLADGSRITVQRKMETGIYRGGEPFKDSRGIKLRHIVLTDGVNEVAWNSPLAPMILARGPEPGQWVVIASPIFCEDHYKFGSPKPPYIQFNYANGQWTHRHVDPAWYGRRSNLLMTYDKFREYDGVFVSAEVTRKFNKPVYKVFERYLFVDAAMKSNCYR